jgi:alkylation response protein AidB-like acyl-CoA dehydrogenase
MLLTQDQEMIRDAVRDFAHAELWPHAAKWDKEHTFPKEAHKGLAALGAYGICVPEELGGAGLDYVTLALVLEEIAAGDGGTSTVISVTNCPVNAILMRYGNDQQKKQWLTPLAQGQMLGAFCLTEPHVGSDASALRTTAVKEGDGFTAGPPQGETRALGGQGGHVSAERGGDHYVINGVKQFITSGKNGHVAIVLAVTDKGAGKKGMSAFLVPTNAPGYTVARVEDKLGQHSSDTAQINFDNCRIPVENLIGKEGEGYGIALGGLEGGRIGIAAQSVGMARSAFEVAVAYAKDRQSFGTAIFNHQAVGFRLAECATQIEAARQLIWHAAALRDAGRPCLKEAAMAKLFASEMAEKVCSVAIQTLGGYGYVTDFPVERIYRDVRVCQIYEGTSDVQKIIIQRALA